MSESDQITTQDLPDEVFDQTIPPVDLKIDLSRNAVSLEEIIKSYIEAALYQTGGIQTKAARLLGMSRRRLQSRMNRYGLESKNFKSQTRNNLYGKKNNMNNSYLNYNDIDELISDKGIIYNTKKYNNNEEYDSPEPSSKSTEELFEQFKQFILFQKMKQDK